MSPEYPPTLTAEDEVRARLATLIAGLHMPSLRNVQIVAGDHHVLLRGEVNSFYAQQVLLHTALRAADGRQVVNEVKVSPGRRVRFRRLSLAALLIAIGLASGCGKAEPQRLAVHPVAGQVTYQGKPATGAFLVFHAKSDKDKFPPPTAQVDKHGNFTLGTYAHDDGAPVGEYAVTVVLRKTLEKNGEFVQGPNLLPATYSKAATTTLTFRVADGANQIPIKIKR